MEGLATNYLSSPITPRKHKTKYNGSIPINALIIIPVQVGSFLGPLIRITTTPITIRMTSIIKMVASMGLLAIINKYMSTGSAESAISRPLSLYSCQVCPSVRGAFSRAHPVPPRRRALCPPANPAFRGSSPRRRRYGSRHC